MTTFNEPESTSVLGFVAPPTDLHSNMSKDVTSSTRAYRSATSVHRRRVFTYLRSKENDFSLHAVDCFRLTRPSSTALANLRLQHAAPYLETSLGDLASGVYVLRMFDGGDTAERFHGRAPIHGAASDADRRSKVISIRLTRGNIQRVTHNTRSVYEQTECKYAKYVVCESD